MPELYIDGIRIYCAAIHVEQVYNSGWYITLYHALLPVIWFPMTVHLQVAGLQGHAQLVEFDQFVYSHGTETDSVKFLLETN